MNAVIPDSCAMYATPLVDQTLHAIVMHRMLSTDQLHRLLTPDSTSNATRQRLKKLVDDNLVEAIGVRGGSGRQVKVWYATAAGVDRALADPDLHRRYVVTRPAPHRSLVAHTLAVNEVGISFVDHARSNDGHECDALAWEHEIAHSLSSNKRTNRLITDAVLSYTLPGDRTTGTGATLVRRFIELDRGTEPVHVLFDKLRRYAQYRSYAPTGPAAKAGSDPYWMLRYPTFPPVCVVIGANPAKSSNQLTQRAHTICSLAADDRLIREQQLGILVCRFEELVEHGPAAPVWWMPGNSQPVAFTGAINP